MHRAHERFVTTEARVLEGFLMTFRSELDHFCEIVGWTSAMIMFAGMASLVFAAAAIDVLR
jgi:hypothetical protein